MSGNVQCVEVTYQARSRSEGLPWTSVSYYVKLLLVVAISLCVCLTALFLLDHR
ncbi:MAG: hypothetical protein WBE37_00115 [Bryobacteraceae bacterium]